MKAPRVLLTLEIGIFCVVLYPDLLSSQRPQAPGKIVVSSIPAGAKVTLDGRAMNQPTNFTFAVSPGDHDVTVTGNGLTKCTKRKVSVPSGAVISVSCLTTGWK